MRRFFGLVHHSQEASKSCLALQTKTSYVPVFLFIFSLKGLNSFSIYNFPSVTFFASQRDGSHLAKINFSNRLQKISGFN